MKNILHSFVFFALINFAAFAQNDPTFMTIGEDTQVRLSEFENIYKKNNTNTLNDDKSLEEYIELFINFKLKVKEAESLGYDTASSFISELAGYRKQLAQPYLIDKKVNELMVIEAYDRMKYDVKASHILVRVSEDASANDTLKAYNKIKEYEKRLSKGTSFDQIKAQILKANNKEEVLAEDLGYFTAFQMVYPFETVAYNTAPGKCSEVVRTSFGYHIIKVWDKREARGEVRVAHIMVKLSDDAGPDERVQAKKKIDQIYDSLQAGVSFEKMASQFSDDKGSARRGGELPWFGTGRMVEEFESIAFDLQKNGDYSKPVQTKYGLHIIKLLDKKVLGSFEETEKEIRNRLAKDTRAKRSRSSLIAQIKTDYGYNPDMKKVNDFTKVIGPEYFEMKWVLKKAEKLNGIIFSLHEKEFSNKKVAYTQADFAQYLFDAMRKQAPFDIQKLIQQSFDRFVTEACVKFEESILEYKYPEFKALMQEYRDGILLFELMEDKIWSRSTGDTAGLKAFYQENKSNYMWDDRLDASIYSCISQEVLTSSKKMAKKHLKGKVTEKEVLASINKENELNLSIESAKFLKEDQALLSKIEWKKGISESFDLEGKKVFAVVHQVIPKMPKTLIEARGMVSTDYQAYLEKTWIAELREKYPYSMDRSVLSQIK